jgi:hypothetical protein
MVPDLAKHFFHGPVLAPVPTSLRQLRGGSGYKNLTLDRRFLPLQTRYPCNTGANDLLLVGSTVVVPKNNLK